MNFWPPFLGAGIRLKTVSDDFRSVVVQMKLYSLNTNYVGTHYGGSLYSMTDPFYMLMLIENLGSDYIVWDKAASIRFKKPGKGKVTAIFTLNEATITAIKNATAGGSKYEPTFIIEIKDESGDTVAVVEKLLYVKKKEKTKTEGDSSP